MGALTSVTSLLGGITSTLNTIDTFTDTVQNFGGQDDREAARNLKAQQNLALKQLQDKQSLDAQQSAQESALRQQQITVDAQNAEERRQRALRSAVAKQRASFGASGISSAGGSAGAVLLGLFDESEEDLTQRNRLDTLKTTALSQGLSQQDSLNILQSQQLRERQALERAARF